MKACWPPLSGRYTFKELEILCKTDDQIETDGKGLKVKSNPLYVAYRKHTRRTCGTRPQMKNC